MPTLTETDYSGFDALCLCYDAKAGSRFSHRKIANRKSQSIQVSRWLLLVLERAFTSQAKRGTCIITNLFDSFIKVLNVHL